MEKTKPRIAIISPSCPPLGGGGVSSAHFNLALTLKEKGYPVILATFGDQSSHGNDGDFIYRFGPPRFLKKLLNSLSARFFRWKEPGTLSYQTRDIFSSQWGAWRCRRILKAFKPDILIFPDHGCPGLSIGKMGQEKTIFICHHNPARFTSPLLFQMPLSSQDIKFAVRLEKRSLKKIDCAICPSSYMANFFKESHDYQGPLHVVPNLLNSKLLENIVAVSVAEKLGMPTDSPVIYIPSGGSSVKGGRYLFEIIRRIAHANSACLFYISGGQNVVTWHELQISGLDRRVFWPGHADYATNLAYIASCTLCVSPTLAESFGMALLEANYLGLPAIAFDVGGNIEIIQNERNGYLIPLLDIDLLIEKTLFLLHSQNAALLRRMSMNSLDSARALVSNASVESYERIFEKLIQGN
ncbi:glycosyltransferase family 4 protein [uncultured Desulfovibrio sp.]|uniref:glycosyltransferase family 4 protein n=1 Tax=uncultured Desulfovibrio sp. TaxID=167968 RepID=UPI00260C9078|nr:glycosyltransferase family 4 protein [uncultured Desulfovibrio sp.]